jgi:hypothetical protein
VDLSFILGSRALYCNVGPAVLDFTHGLCPEHPVFSGSLEICMACARPMSGSTSDSFMHHRATRLAARAVAAARSAVAQQALNVGCAATVGIAQSQAVPSLQHLSACHLHTSMAAFRADPAMEPEISESHKAALRSVKPQVIF